MESGRWSRRIRLTRGVEKSMSAKKRKLYRVGDTVTDGLKSGRIIAVSGEDVGIQWKDGSISGVKWVQLKLLHPPKVR